MGKRIVVCCDGTWNTPDQMYEGRACPTNVTKLALSVAPVGADGMQQRMFYHRGVGTRRWERVRGGAFGLGLSRNIQDAYRLVVENFEPGDELFFLGFSRGAYTARSTVGLIRNAGVLRREHADRVGEAYRLYRSRADEARPTGTEAKLFRASYSHETRIRFIGVWDTVGALGIPLSGLRWANAFNRRWQFHDTDLSSTVDAAFHALAVDEKRPPFQPAVWSQQADARSQRLEQVWFSGGHCDVGGGTPDSSLSDLALLWMADRARSCGLGFDETRFSTEEVPGSTCEFPVRPDPWGPMHESRKGFYRLLRRYDRPLGVAEDGEEYVASTTLQRREKDADYAPPGLLAHLEGPHRVMDI